MIHELLNTDPLTGWTIPQLKRRLGISSNYQILTQINKERKQGYPICQTRHIWKRYYLADSLASYESFVKRYRADVHREENGLYYSEAILERWKGKTKKLGQTLQPLSHFLEGRPAGNDEGMHNKLDRLSQYFLESKRKKTGTRQRRLTLTGRSQRSEEKTLDRGHTSPKAFYWHNNRLHTDKNTRYTPTGIEALSGVRNSRASNALERSQAQKCTCQGDPKTLPYSELSEASQLIGDRDSSLHTREI